jgi:hypothetical protein
MNVSKSYQLLSFLTLMYGLFPFILIRIVGSEFLLNEFYYNDFLADLLLFTFLTIVMLIPISHGSLVENLPTRIGKFAMTRLSDIYAVLLLIIFLVGLFFRIQEFGRAEMLEVLGFFFIPGMSLLQIFFYYELSKKAMNVIVFWILLMVAIDLLYYGKQYFIQIAVFLAFLLDKRRITLTTGKFMLTVLGSVLFIYLINISRGDFHELNFFSTFMEFRGVVSSIQYSDFYSLDVLNFDSFRRSIEEYSISEIGFNLAFHPLLYFKAMGAFVYLKMTLYALLIYYVLCSFRSLGTLLVLIVGLNFIHYLRHGIDIFVLNIVSQLLIVWILFNFKLDAK